jgi:hypothetical protein
LLPDALQMVEALPQLSDPNDYLPGNFARNLIIPLNLAEQKKYEMKFLFFFLSFFFFCSFAFTFDLSSRGQTGMALDSFELELKYGSEWRLTLEEEEKVYFFFFTENCNN